jgi:iron complex outermembrane recepter protein
VPNYKVAMPLIRLIFFFLLFLTCQSIGRTQTTTPCNCFIKGIVKDQETGQPIANALISVESTFVITDTLGHYFIGNLCQGKYTINCTIIGYKSIKQAITLNHEYDNTDIHLNEAAIHLENVEIKTRRIQTPLSQTATAIEGNTLIENRAETLGETLKNIIGVTTFQTGGTIAKPVIHGLHSNRILILNNGIRQEGQQWGSEHAPEIDQFVANSLTVIKGASSVRYGADAMAGVILIEPAPLPNTAKIGGELNLVGTTNGQQGTISGMIEGRFTKLKVLNWRLQGTLKAGGNIQTPNYYLDNTGTREHNFSATVGYRTTGQNTTLFYSRYATNTGIFSGSHIGNLTDLLQVIANGEPLVKPNFSYQIQRPNQQIEHDLIKLKTIKKLGDNALNLSLGYQYDRRAEYDIHGQQAASVPALLFRLSTLSGDLIYEHQPILGATGQIGLSGSYQYNLMDGRPLIPDFEQNNIGLFWIERLVKSKWEFEAGLRFDKRSLQVFKFANKNLDTRQHDFAHFSGNLGGVFRPTEQWSIRTNVSSAWRPPNVSELYSNGVHHGAAAYEEGNDKLLAETTINTSLGVVFMSDKIKLETEIYNHWFDNYIYLQPQSTPILTVRGAFPFFKYVQTQATFTGVDLATDWQLTPKLKHIAKMSYLRAFDQINQDYLVMIPANRIENGLKYGISPFSKWSESYFSVSNLFVLEQKNVPPNSDFVAPPPSYHLWSLQVASTYQLSTNQKIIVSISVNNLLNTAYRDYMNRFRYYALEMGRNMSIKLAWKF